jgi:RHS repeat-associated protein
LSDAQFQASLLPDTVLDPSLTPAEMREACRALRGRVLRQEVYAEDRTAAADRPYSVSERNYTVTKIQGFGPNLHASFVAHARETLDEQFERALYTVGGNTVSDPRVTHAVVLATDAYDNELLSATLTYGRRHDDPNPVLTADDRAKQKQLLASAVESAFTNAIDVADAYRVPVNAEASSYELIKLMIPPGGANPTPTIDFNDLNNQIIAAGDGLHDLPFEDVNATGAVNNAPYRRLLSRTQALYRSDDLTQLLPLGALESLGLSGKTLQQALTPGLITTVFQRQSGAGVENLIPDPGTTIGGKGADQGGYVMDVAGNAWAPSNQIFYAAGVDVAAPTGTAAMELAYARQHFFSPRVFSNPFDKITTARLDAYDLLVTGVTDAAQNTVSATLDYRVLQPTRITEPNGNRAEAAYDSFGRVVATALRGKVTDTLGDSLAQVKTDLTAQDLSDFFADPKGSIAATLLAGATTRVVYDLDRYAASGAAYRPAYTATIARETHLSDLGQGAVSKLQVRFTYSDGLGREIQQKGQSDDGPLTSGGVAVSPRWICSGWQVFTNKGQPARVYEPFFDDTHDFKFANKVGVSKVIFYDPPGRPVVTLNPDMSWEKVLFDPWSQTAWDVNDTVLIADPAQDGDAGRYLSRLPGVDFTNTWYKQRIGGALGPEQQDAAAKTAAHAATPGIEYFDTLGRAFLTIADNGKDTLGNLQLYLSRSTLDIQGNARVLVDALGRQAVRRDFDMLKGEIHQSSMEAGERWSLTDVGRQNIRSWNSRGSTFASDYDDLRRPVGVYLSDATQKNTLIGRTVYGEAVLHAADSNLLGQVYQQYDQAGFVTQPLYDFKGNPQTSQRQLAAEYRKTLNWSAAVAPEGPLYATTTLRDALNRPTLITAPDQSAIRPAYNAASQLDGIDVNVRGKQQGGQPVWSAYVTGIEYDAKAQRSLISYGNGAVTEYSHDAETFRLTRLLTTRPHPPGNAVDILQDLNYTYDPKGNVTYLEDNAQQKNFFRQQMTQPVNDYTYDPLYRLIQATGREYLGKIGATPKAPMPVGPDDTFYTNLDNPGDPTAMGNYTEQYLYDAVGNMLSLSHAGTDPLNPGWTRQYNYQEASLIEPALKSNRLSSTQVGAVNEAYGYSGNGGLSGNITAMPHLSLMQWDFRDQLQATSTQAFNQGTPSITWYVYDGSGQRVRKVTDAAAAGNSAPLRKSERIYLGIFEIFRLYDPQGAPTDETQTLHVLDDTRRIALIETVTISSNGATVNVPLARYQFADHLGSSCVELDDLGNTISMEVYFPFGATAYQATNKSIMAAAKRYRYTGKEHDEENGFSYHGARYYALWLGQWISCDPAGADWTLYSYSRCNPISFNDLNGKEPAAAQQPTQELKLPRGLDDSERRPAWDAATQEQRAAALARASPDEHAIFAGWVGRAFGEQRTALSTITEPEHFGGIPALLKVQGLAITSIAGAGVTIIGEGLGLLGSLQTGVSAGHLLTGTDITGRTLSADEKTADKINVALGVAGLVISGVASVVAGKGANPPTALAPEPVPTAAPAGERVMLDTTVVDGIRRGTAGVEETLVNARAEGVNFSVPRPVFTEASQGGWGPAARSAINRLGLPIDEGGGLASRVSQYDEALTKGIRFEGLYGADPKKLPVDLVISSHVKSAGASLWTLERRSLAAMRQFGVSLWRPVK